MLGLALCVPAARASLPRPHRQPRKIVRIIEKLELRWQHAELAGDTTVLASMLSENYLGIYADGTLATRAETLESFRKGGSHFHEIDIFDRKIRVFGSTAVVISKARVDGTHDGEAVHGLYRYTRVYHRRNGTWKIVSFEASRIHRHRLQVESEDGPGNGPEQSSRAGQTAPPKR